MAWSIKMLWDNDDTTDVPGEFDTIDEAFQFGADYSDDFFGGIPDVMVESDDENDDTHVFRKPR